MTFFLDGVDRIGAPPTWFAVRTGGFDVLVGDAAASHGTEAGVVVMEVNDNPNLEHGIEDAVGKDEVWIRILKWFIARLEQ